MLFALADRAAYQAKDAGRNRVQLAGGSTRSYARRKVNWSGHVVPVGSAGYSIETVEIGEGGFSYRTGQGLPPDTLVETTLVTPDGVILRRAARIAWCRPAPQVGWEIAVRFVEAGGEDRRHLARWIQGDAEYSLDAVGAPARRAGFEPQSKSAFLR
jgi:hypothetical protein